MKRLILLIPVVAMSALSSCSSTQEAGQTSQTTTTTTTATHPAATPRPVMGAGSLRLGGGMRSIADLAAIAVCRNGAPFVPASLRESRFRLRFLPPG